MTLSNLKFQNPNSLREMMTLMSEEGRQRRIMASLKLTI